MWTESARRSAEARASVQGPLPGAPDVIGDQGDGASAPSRFQLIAAALGWLCAVGFLVTAEKGEARWIGCVWIVASGFLVVHIYRVRRKAMRGDTS